MKKGDKVKDKYSGERGVIVDTTLDGEFIVQFGKDKMIKEASDLTK